MLGLVLRLTLGLGLGLGLANAPEFGVALQLLVRKCHFGHKDRHDEADGGYEPWQQRGPRSGSGS